MIRRIGAVLALFLCMIGMGFASAATANDAGRLLLAPSFGHKDTSNTPNALAQPPPPPAGRLNNSPHRPLLALDNRDFVDRLAPLASDELIDPGAERPLSPVERLYADRYAADMPLRHFGTDMWETPARAVSVPQTAAPTMPLATPPVGDDYVLGPGDRIRISVLGDSPVIDHVRVPADGMLTIAGLPPLDVRGQTLGDVRAALAAADATQFNRRVILSVEALRPLSVSVVGAVAKPGLQSATPAHSVFDALQMAGGITAMGSLRAIQRVRADGTIDTIDLYDWLIDGRAPRDSRLRDGDRILVPPIGPSLAVGGAVKRPAIYELPPGNQRSVNVSEALRMAGGALPGKGGRLHHFRQDDHGNDRIITLPFGKIATLGDGDMLILGQPTPATQDVVELVGHVRTPGFVARAERPTLRRLLDPARVIRDGYYPLFALIERRDPQNLTRRLIPFVPLSVLDGSMDDDLISGDRIHIFADETLRDVMHYESDASILLDERDDHTALPASFDPDDRGRDDLSPLVLQTIRDHSVSIQGSVALPGLYPVGGAVRIRDVLAASGSFLRDADTSFVEITRHDPVTNTRVRDRGPLADAADRFIRAGDQVRVPRTADQGDAESVLLLGEVGKPGRYDVIAGETLSSLLERAGGLTPYAYAAGAVFSRESERTRERALYTSKAQDLELRLAARMGEADRDRARPSDAEIDAAHTLIRQLRGAEPLGRITVEADPSLLAARPEDDILLEGGDRIYIPRRPLSVRVAGEVQSPAALQFISGQSPRTYIEQAGGPSYYADIDRAFVVYPDGSADRLAVSMWNTRRDVIPPGSTIIVPRDPEPFRFIDSARDITQILSNLATAALFADEIGDD